ncbi:hypothetical protein HYU21_01550 [Candidatus Woesearchaeota archaeon]|nr:hypothetical protein [Candidatus Woesearchaeota archaeon]
MPLIKSEEESRVEEMELTLIGSLTLNNFVGGLNEEAIYASANISKKPIIVWFPTINADNFLKRSKEEVPKEWCDTGFKSRAANQVKSVKIMGSDGNLTTKVIKLLVAIKKNNCILATGHLSWQEAKLLVEKAVQMGINKIIVTHPIYQLIDMPLNVQLELSKYDGVYIEHNYAMYAIDKIPITKIAEQIKFVGAEKCILSSDVGQVSSLSPSEALEKFTQLLQQEGITEQQLQIMGEKNPKTLIS